MNVLLIVLVTCLSGVVGICTIDESKCILEQIKTKIWLMEQLISKESETCQTKQAITKEPVNCDEGWKKYNDHCYFLSLEAAQWNDALDSCMELGSSLTSITSAEENEFVTSMASSVTDTHTFIGGMLIGNNVSNWRWISTLERLSFTNWGPSGEPQQLNLEEKCIGMVPSFGYKWADLHCNTIHPYICKK